MEEEDEEAEFIVNRIQGGDDRYNHLGGDGACHQPGQHITGGHGGHQEGLPQEGGQGPWKKKSAILPSLSQCSATFGTWSTLRATSCQAMGMRSSAVVLIDNRLLEKSVWFQLMIIIASASSIAEQQTYNLKRFTRSCRS